MAFLSWIFRFFLRIEFISSLNKFKMRKIQKTTLILREPDFQVFAAIFALCLVAIVRYLFAIAFFGSKLLVAIFWKLIYFDQFLVGFSLSSTSCLTALKNFENSNIWDGTSLFWASKLLKKLIKSRKPIK